jgi:hypothetical protein
MRTCLFTVTVSKHTDSSKLEPELTDFDEGKDRRAHPAELCNLPWMASLNVYRVGRRVNNFLTGISSDEPLPSRDRADFVKSFYLNRIIGATT